MEFNPIRGQFNSGFFDQGIYTRVKQSATNSLNDRSAEDTANKVLHYVERELKGGSMSGYSNSRIMHEMSQRRAVNRRRGEILPIIVIVEIEHVQVHEQKVEKLKLAPQNTPVVKQEYTNQLLLLL